MRQRLAISFSGGRTSAYMTWRVLRDYGEAHEILVLFANTGQEHEKTLEFVNRCDKEFGFNVVWLEAVVNPEAQKGTRHKVVDYATAARKGEPFEAVIAKYGIPNPDFPHCNRELKLAVMNSYVREAGWGSDFYKVIGIRADEMDRVAHDYIKEKKWYPLVDMRVFKEDITGWWMRQSFDLEIPEHLGNCTWCWKKSHRKHMTLAQDYPEVFDFPRRMEALYADSGAGEGAEDSSENTAPLMTFSRTPKSPLSRLWMGISSAKPG